MRSLRSYLEPLVGDMMDIIDTAAKALSRPLCDHCLGRLFGMRGHGFTNDERGHALRVVLHMKEQLAPETIDAGTDPDERCWLCEGLFDDLDTLHSLVLERLEELEFDTFLVGSRIDPMLQNREEMLWSELGLRSGEQMKAEVNREVGKRVEEALRAAVEFERPDVTVIIDTQFYSAELQIAPLFIYGRYRKLIRGIPQTRWPCRNCHGKGCERCGGTGKMYDESVEQLVGAPMNEVAEGTDYTFHGMGREDIDARMLGNGRPFVLEVSNPRRRHLDLDALASTINSRSDGKVEVVGLRESTRDEIVRIKQSKAEKTYRVAVEFDTDVAEEKLKKAVDACRREIIQQRTPQRVAHRRADRCRERKVKRFAVLQQTGATAQLEVRAERGLYIKELMHGDDGRTQPNLADNLDCAVTVEHLDVVGVHDEGDPVPQ